MTAERRAPHDIAAMGEAVASLPAVIAPLLWPARCAWCDCPARHDHTTHGCAMRRCSDTGIRLLRILPDTADEMPIAICGWHLQQIREASAQHYAAELRRSGASG